MVANGSEPDSLDDFELEHVTLLGVTRRVYRTGSGPAVIVLHEIPGITPLVAEFGRQVAAHGMTAVMPSLIGTPGKPPSGGYLAESMAKACVSREFVVFARGRTSPITRWLRLLAAREHEACGGPGVGVVGMCLTGGFALAMMVDDTVVAPVLSQPAVPFPLLPGAKGDLGIDGQDLQAVRRRAAAGTCVLGLRFTGDTASPGARFDTLRRELGDNFIGVEIDSAPGNPWGYRKSAHSVLTEDYSDAEGSPTRAALEQVLEFMATRLEVGESRASDEAP